MLFFFLVKMRGTRDNDEYKRSSSADDGSRRLWSILPLTKAPSKQQKLKIVSKIQTNNTARPELIRLTNTLNTPSTALDLKSSALGEIHALLKNDHDVEFSSTTKLKAEELKATTASLRNLNLNLFPTRPHTIHLPFKLIDEKMILNAQQAQKRIIDNNIFVVGVIGKTGSGKTAIAHSICGQSFSSISTRPHVRTTGLGI
jgi:Cdc6-like AAA superfamily ATPase